jgi:hypothetical protein
VLYLDEALAVSCVDEEFISIEAFRLLLSLASLRELRIDLEEELAPLAKLLAPPEDDSSSFRFWLWTFVEPSSLEEEEDVEDVDVVDELELTGLVAACSRFCMGLESFGLPVWLLIMKSLFSCF